MRRIVLPVIIFLVCVLFKATAQNTSYGFLAGASSRNFSYGTGFFKRLSVGPDVGAFVELPYTKTFSLVPMIEYSAQGSKSGPLVTTADYNSPELDNKVKFGNLNYLMIPVLSKFSFPLGEDSHMKVFTSVGPYLGFLLSADQVLITHSGKNVDVPAVDVKSQMRAVNAGLKANVGFSYDFNVNRIFVQAGGNYGIIKIQKDTRNGGNYSGAAAITVGYSFSIDNSFQNNDHILPKR